MAKQVHPIKRWRVPLHITGTAFVHATSAKKAHALARSQFGGKIIGHNFPGASPGVELGNALVIYGPEHVSTLEVVS